MNEIQPFKQLTVILLKDGQSLFTSLTVEQIAELLNQRDFVIVDGVGFGKFEVKKFYTHRPDTMENFILSQPQEIQKLLKAREILKKARIGKGFESIEEIQNYINKNLSHVK